MAGGPGKTRQAHRDHDGSNNRPLALAAHSRTLNNFASLEYPYCADRAQQNPDSCPHPHCWLHSRALLLGGKKAVAAGRRALTRVDLVRVNDAILNLAGSLDPIELRSLDAIHLATAARLGSDLGEIVTYDERMTVAARAMGYRVATPA